jgi:glycerol uptake facilitator-like aquaporin
MVAHVLAEFLGTGLLIGSIAYFGTPLMIVLAFATAVILAGPISGAHLNPAVTVWALLRGKVNQTTAVGYVVAQLLAAGTVWATVA